MMADMSPEGGLTEIYRLHRAELLRFLTARTGSAAEAEDVVQELWIKALATDAGPIANGRAYLYRTAQNLVLDRLRERRRREARDRQWTDAEIGPASPEGETPDHRLNALEQMEQREEAARLASAIGNLPEGARRAFQLHKIDGLSHAEVAERLGISRSGVEKHMAVAMKYLRRALKD
ncbi:RNA polymerase sigma factor [Sphingobium aquiterrae]|uniref:RNA polymerase sigma factor n=1 Tax=Sphingobium aquiterrae TaxID=2038656 RepID=UPI00301998F0